MANKYYGRLDNGTNPQAVLYPDEKHSVPTSYFDESCIRTQTQTLGGIYPFFTMKVVPKDQIDLGVDLLVTVNSPFVRRMLSTLNVTTHFYYDRMSHLWEGGKNHFTKGRTGNIVITYPYVNLEDSSFEICKDSLTSSANPSSNVYKVSFNNVASLSTYLDVPADVFLQSTSGGVAVKNPETDLADASFKHFVVNSSYSGSSPASGYSDSITTMPTYVAGSGPFANALPFAMYQKIYAENYAPKNLLVNNKYWYPDNPDDFILGYNTGGTQVNYLNREEPVQTSSPHVPDFSTVPLGAISANEHFDRPVLTSLRFRQWQGDYFTAGVPWIVRGDMYKINFTDVGLIPVKGIKSDGTLSPDYYADVNGAATIASASNASADRGQLTLGQKLNSIDSFNAWSGVTSTLPSTFSLYADPRGTSLFALTANQIYELLALSRWQERNTRTDGDYNSLIKAHFNVDPNSEDWHSVYIGGTFSRMQFSEVLQTNQDANSVTPLGSQVSRASLNQSGYVGRFNVPDFGFIMGVCSIIPNTFYTQGLPRKMWYDMTNESEYYPEFNNMAPQGVLNKEIFYNLGGNLLNNDLFNYTERYADYKFMPNTMAGHFTVPPSISTEWSSYSYARYFSGIPSFNSRFVTCYGFRRDMWSVPSQPEFSVQIAVKCDAVRPIPYDSIPGGNINV